MQERLHDVQALFPNMVVDCLVTGSGACIVDKELVLRLNKVTLTESVILGSLVTADRVALWADVQPILSMNECLFNSWSWDEMWTWKHPILKKYCVSYRR